MTTGISVLLAAVGAILAFAVRDTFSAVDLSVIGYILMAAGAAGLVISALRANPRRKTTVVEQQQVTPSGTVTQQDIETR